MPGRSWRPVSSASVSCITTLSEDAGLHRDLLTRYHLATDSEDLGSKGSVEHGFRRLHSVHAPRGGTARRRLMRRRRFLRRSPRRWRGFGLWLGGLVLLAIFGRHLYQVYWLDEGLFLAAARGNASQVKALLSSGASPNAAWEDGTSALAAARSAGHKDIVTILEKAGATKLLSFGNCRSQQRAPNRCVPTIHVSPSMLQGFVRASYVGSLATCLPSPSGAGTGRGRNGERGRNGDIPKSP